MYYGSCLCRKVKFSIENKICNIIHCHCSLCRKSQGSAFATNANVASEDFNFLSGKKNLTSYSSSENHTKYFCKTCGSPIMSKNSLNPNIIRIRLGTIESDIDESPEAHIFVASKANWEEITGSLPQYNEYTD